jgi:FtsH-binding integral membrane protein
MYEERSQPQPQLYPYARVDTRPLLRNVYALMTLGLLVTAGVAYLTSITPALLNLLNYPFVIFGVFIGQIILVIALAAAVWKLPTWAATAIFFGYAALMGFTLSMILLLYAPATLTLAFVSTSALFGAMTIVGLTTKADLTKMGTFLFMGLIGLLVAMVVNIFLRSSAFDWIISIVGVLLFTGLTAWDTQRIVRMASDPRVQAGDSGLMRRLSILGALKLYLDFINLFLFILRLMGRRS